MRVRPIPVAAMKKGMARNELDDEQPAERPERPGKLEHVEGNALGDREAGGGGDREREGGEGEKGSGGNPEPIADHHQEGAARPESEEGGADHEEREVVPLDDREEPRQQDLVAEGGGGEQCHRGEQQDARCALLVAQGGARETGVGARFRLERKSSPTPSSRNLAPPRIRPGSKGPRGEARIVGARAARVDRGRDVAPVETMTSVPAGQGARTGPGGSGERSPRRPGACARGAASGPRTARRRGSPAPRSGRAGRRAAAARGRRRR